MPTLHTKFRTGPTITRKDVLSWCLAVAPFAAMIVLVLWGEWLF